MMRSLIGRSSGLAQRFRFAFFCRCRWSLMMRCLLFALSVSTNSRKHIWWKVNSMLRLLMNAVIHMYDLCCSREKRKEQDVKPSASCFDWLSACLLPWPLHCCGLFDPAAMLAAASIPGKNKTQHSRVIGYVHTSKRKVSSNNLYGRPKNLCWLPRLDLVGDLE